MKSKVKKDQQIIVAKQIDYVFEGWQLLMILADERKAGTSFMKLQSIIKNKYGYESAFTKEYIQLLQKIGDQAFHALNQDKSRIQYLFGHQYEYTAFELVFCFLQNDYKSVAHMSAEEAYESFKGLSERDRDVFFFHELTKDMSEDEFHAYMGNNEEGIIVSDVDRVKNIFTYIQKMNLSMETREFIQDCYLKRNLYAEEIVKYLQVAINIIRKYQDDLIKNAGQWEEYWTAIIQAGQFSSVWSTTVENTVLNEDKIVVLPSFIQCAVVWINIGDNVLPHEDDMLPVCRMGVILLDNFNMQSKVKEEYQLEDYQNKLKLLADKSKFDILMYIKDQPAYGSEIAKHFGLTTATVSHHMNRLLEEQLIIVEQQNRKIYYRSNKDVLQNLLEACNNLLTK